MRNSIMNGSKMNSRYESLCPQPGRRDQGNSQLFILRVGGGRTEIRGGKRISTSPRV